MPKRGIPTFQYTPAPWEAIYERTHGWSVIGGNETLSNGDIVRRDVIERFAGWRPDAENGVNARLVAAAPDLLEAARAVLAGLNPRIKQTDQQAVSAFIGIADLAAAIAKATGGAE